MRVLVNALSARRGGGRTYIRNLLAHADAFEGERIFVLAPADLDLPEGGKIERISQAPALNNPLVRSLWERLCLRRMSGSLEADVLFCPGGLINTSVPRGCRTVTMFRNMLPFDYRQRTRYPVGWMRIRNRILERAMLRSMAKADLVIFVSEYARKLIERRLAGRLNKAATIPHGINQAFRADAANPPQRPDVAAAGEYILYVSILDYYKNQIEVVRAFNMLRKRRETPERLVLAGLDKGSYAELVRAEVRRLGLKDSVIFAGNVPYDGIPALWHHAKMGIFASECENCPNILLEAMAAGCPMLVSDRQPMPEFGQDAVVYFDPGSPQELCDRLLSVIDDGDMLAQLAGRARARSEEYDWNTTATRTWAAIEEVLD